VKINKIIWSKRKGVKLSVMTDGYLIVRAPRRYSQARIQLFVDENTDWILKQKKWVKEYYPQIPKRKYVPDENFMYLGKLYKLSITQNDRIPLTFSDNRFLLASGHQANAHEDFLKWYRQSNPVKRVRPVKQNMYIGNCIYLASQFVGSSWVRHPYCVKSNCYRRSPCCLINTVTVNPP